MLEADFQSNVIETAQFCGWKVHHGRPAMNQSGQWSTPIQGDAGFPDLVLARAGRVIFAELKSERGKPSEAQLEWLRAIRGPYLSDNRPEGAPHAYVWYPRDMQRVAKLLSPANR